MAHARCPLLARRSRNVIDQDREGTSSTICVREFYRRPILNTSLPILKLNRGKGSSFSPQQSKDTAEI